MKNKLSELIIVAIATLLSAFLKEVFFEEGTIVNYVYIICISIGLILIMYGSLYVFLRVFKIDSKYHIVGNFVEITLKDEQDHISFFSISHNFFGDTFKIRGDTFISSTGTHYAEWWSVSVGLLDKGKLYYLYSAVISGRKGEVTGITRLNFLDSNSSFSEGIGYLVDNMEPLTRVNFDFERINRSDIKKAIGKRSIKSRKDRIEFINYWCAGKNKQNAKG